MRLISASRGPDFVFKITQMPMAWLPGYLLKFFEAVIIEKF